MGHTDFAVLARPTRVAVTLEAVDLVLTLSVDTRVGSTLVDV